MFFFVVYHSISWFLSMLYMSMLHHRIGIIVSTLSLWLHPCIQTNNSILHNPNTNILINFVCNLFNNFSMKQWALNCQREDLLHKDAVSVHKNCRLCAKHFQDSCFRNYSRNWLGKTAVPTRFSYKLGIKRKRFPDETSGMWHLTIPLPEMRDMRQPCTADFCMKVGYRAPFIQRLSVW
jgi:hypothetical protein